MCFFKKSFRNFTRVIKLGSFLLLPQNYISL